MPLFGYLNADLDVKVLPEYDKSTPSSSSDPRHPPAPKVDARDRPSSNPNSSKKRPRDAVPNPVTVLCQHIACGSTCPNGSSCRNSHSLESFLTSRPADVVPHPCYLYSTFGRCPYGLNCLAGGSHCDLTTGSNYARPQSSGGVLPVPEPLNCLPWSVVDQLRRNKYPFVCSRGETVFKHECPAASAKEAYGIPKPTLRKVNPRDPDEVIQAAEDANKKALEEYDCAISAAKAAAEAEEERLEKEEQEQLAAKPVKGADLTPLPSKSRRPIDFNNKIYVAPLTTVGNLPFRRLMKRFGADITCGEMALCANLLQGQASEWALLKRHASEDVFGVQLAAGWPDAFARAGELIEKQCDVDFIDLNCGCPIDLVCDKGAGAALMTKKNKLMSSLVALQTAFSGPVTIKIRTGWDEKAPFAHELVPTIQSWGLKNVAAIMLHGRSRTQRYSKLANWEYIGSVAKTQVDAPGALRRIPIIGNGDIMSFTDYNERVLQDGLSRTAMLARGALMKPWLPTEIKEQRHWDISASERLDILRDYANFGMEHWGADRKGVDTVRRFMLEWLSFLYRYVPVGIIRDESLPQRMNQRPPKELVGRSDLETLMMSPNSSDWVKLTELFLGPVPEGFQFEPKHKANAY